MLQITIIVLLLDMQYIFISNIDSITISSNDVCFKFNMCGRISSDNLRFAIYIVVVVVLTYSVRNFGENN